MNFRAGRAFGLFTAIVVFLWVTRGTSAGEAAVSRDELLAGMEKVMGKFPASERRCDLDPQVAEEVDCGDYVRKFLTYQSEPGGRVPAYLLVPKANLLKKSRGGKPIGILTLHQTHALGQKVVVGLGASPNDEYGVELAKRGFVCLAPAYPHLANYAPDLSRYESGTMKAIWDNARGLDLLATWVGCDPERFGAIGHSLGGHNSLFTAAFDERIKVVATSCGFDSFRDYMNGNIKGWTSKRYMPKLLEFAPERYPFDFDTVLEAISPRRVFVNAPQGDTNFKWESVDRVVAKAKMESAVMVEVEHPDCQHSFPKEMREKAYRVIEEVLLNDR
jgi:dienelactone hydrolase